jgi:hypothetical protein
LLSIISGLLVSVATELAVFLLVEGPGWTAGGSLEELRESHEKGLLNFLPEGAGAGAGAGAGGGGAAAVAGGLLDCESVADGDHGMGGRALVKLLKDMVLDAFSGGALFSKRESVGCYGLQAVGWAEHALLSWGRRCCRVVIEIDGFERAGGCLRERARDLLLCWHLLRVGSAVRGSGLGRLVLVVGVGPVLDGRAFDGLLVFCQ